MQTRFGSTLKGGIAVLAFFSLFGVATYVGYLGVMPGSAPAPPAPDPYRAVRAQAVRWKKDGDAFWDKLRHGRDKGKGISQCRQLVQDPNLKDCALDPIDLSCDDWSWSDHPDQEEAVRAFQARDQCAWHALDSTLCWRREGVRPLRSIKFAIVTANYANVEKGGPRLTLELVDEYLRHTISRIRLYFGDRAFIEVVEMKHKIRQPSDWPDVDQYVVPGVWEKDAYAKNDYVDTYGGDFTGYKYAALYDGDHHKYDAMFLMNDSIVGPFENVSRIHEESGQDFDYYFNHFWSEHNVGGGYFMAWSGKFMRSPAFSDFWNKLEAPCGRIGQVLFGEGAVYKILTEWKLKNDPTRASCGTITHNPFIVDNYFPLRNGSLPYAAVPFLKRILFTKKRSATATYVSPDQFAAGKSSFGEDFRHKVVACSETKVSEPGPMFRFRSKS